MNKGRFNLAMLICACSVVFTGAAGGEAFAATKKGKEPIPARTLVVTTPPKLQVEPSQKPASLRAKKSGTSPAVLERQPKAVQKQAQQGPTEAKLPIAKNHRRMTVHKKETPKADVQPRTDLMYHGMLESPQRYNPRRNHLGAGVPDPHTPELTRDHFQELDRNQDGKIDPVERAFGRLDMDRDLYDRRPR